QLGWADRLQQQSVRGQLALWQAKAVTRDDDCRNAALLCVGGDFNPRAVGQEPVGQNNIVRLAHEKYASRCYRRSRVYFMTIANQHVLDKHPQVSVVFD